MKLLILYFKYVSIIINLFSHILYLRYFDISKINQLIRLRKINANK